MHDILQLFLDIDLCLLDTDTDFEEFYRRAHLYEIEWKTDGPASLSAGDWEEIQEIATLCTWEGGKASALAQALCATPRDSIVEPLIACTGVDPRNSQPNFSFSPDELLVYPNPSSTGWNVFLPLGSAEFRILDMSGKTWLVKEANSQSLFLSPNGLFPGIYILLVEDPNDKVLSTTKIILQR